MDIAAERAYPTPYANSPLLPMLILSLARQRVAPKTSTTFNNEYDYIVNWKLKTVPQKHTAKALVDRQVLWPGGKGLGGVSMFNDLIYSRGFKKTYDKWAEQGAVGWSYDDIFPYFVKLEDNRDPEYLANGYHSVGGPMTIEKPGYQSPIKGPIFEAAKNLGYKRIDPTTTEQTGMYDFQGTIRNGQRCTPSKAYLVPAENRTNLNIVANAYVQKILIEGQQATGVQFEFGGQTHQVRARREVIVSAGTVKTPQLLMLSGIGPKKHLQKFKVRITDNLHNHRLVADLPVGDNLQCLVAAPLNFQLSPNIPTVEERLSNPNNMKQYIHSRTGPLAGAELIPALGFLNGAKGTDPTAFPTSEMYFIEIPQFVAKDETNLKPEVYEQIYGPYANISKYICVVNAVQPKSRGTVRLQSVNPYDDPLIDPNYFAEPEDMQVTIDGRQGLKVCQKIGTSEAMQKVGSKPFQTKIPGCHQLSDDEDKYFECLARGSVFPIVHPVGTAKMGNPQDPTTVVDPFLRVKGIKGLRIVDGATMPIIPSSNSNVPQMMLAEKASDLIKQTINCPGYLKGYIPKINNNYSTRNI
ncbi:glucose dehydrogenase [Caerostris extrusa]|uniref:Glucose dehydrogenase n=1 Tax=Caerostris extrusa TaxID=172846 RepID=A0AAV4Y3J8_CAEEX|nr:glucose dehydrogenase [Caerostris extrusa]